MNRLRGSITVEASIVVPFVMAVIFLLVYITIVLCQQTYLRSYVDNQALELSDKYRPIYTYTDNEYTVNNNLKYSADNQSLYYQISGNNNYDDWEYYNNYI